MKTSKNWETYNIEDADKVIVMDSLNKLKLVVRDVPANYLRYCQESYSDDEMQEVAESLVESAVDLNTDEEICLGDLPMSRYMQVMQTAMQGLNRPNLKRR